MSLTTLLDGWSRVIRVSYKQFRRDGHLQVQDRDLAARGDGVTVLLIHEDKETALLLKQPRIVATLTGHTDGETIEACSGLLHNDDPLSSAYREVEQETGHKPQALFQIASVYASPGASLEVVHLFIGEYSEATRVGPGGGLSHEGEDIELLEVPLVQAMCWISEGIIRDARTVVLLQHAMLAKLQLL